MSCDASPAILSHASKTLAKAERNQNHLENEALVLVFGVKRFHEYCFGYLFIIQTDHKPLLSVIG